MATLTQQEAGIATTTVTPQTYTTTVAYPSGTLVLAFLATAGSVTHNTFTDSRGNTWTKIQQQAQATAPAVTLSVWICTVTTGITIGDTITMGFSSGTTYDLVLCTPTGVSLGTVDNSSSGTGTTGASYSVTGYTVTTGSLEILAVSAGYSALATDLTATGWTELAGNNQATARSLAIAYRTSAGGTSTASCSAVNSHPWVEVAVALIVGVNVTVTFPVRTDVLITG